EPAGKISGRPPPKGDPGQESERKTQPRSRGGALLARKSDARGKRVKKHNQKRNSGDSHRRLRGIEKQEKRYKKKTAASSNQSSVSSDNKPERDKPQVLEGQRGLFSISGIKPAVSFPVKKNFRGNLAMTVKTVLRFSRSLYLYI